VDIRIIENKGGEAVNCYLFTTYLEAYKIFIKKNLIRLGIH